ncbi:hypothetical protein F2Q70_00043838 [Brassica cretica]|uniref:Uncharacterized protein n=1 Tax=Brassica cretica TaxID=69181 RepID=A0A8S9KLX1_BRACR|nr:hypothetical protein F2Q70_00043838 [Brassica cretica]KAF3518414.1 hypothetical protein DY000_02061306 [Brassica cretica]
MGRLAKLQRLGMVRAVSGCTPEALAVSESRTAQRHFRILSESSDLSTATSRHGCRAGPGPNLQDYSLSSSIIDGNTRFKLPTLSFLSPLFGD